MRRIQFGNSQTFWIKSIALLVCIVGCATTPITNRKQLLLVPEGQEITMGLDSFAQIMSEQEPSSNREWDELVSRVGQRIAAAAERPDYQWEFRVIQSPQQNAFCLPGGKVAVYEGILPVCQSEAGLAVVMAHEVAHALARHGGERMSQTYVVDGMGRALSYLNRSQQVVSQQQLSRAYGIASEYGFVLPYSRKHESEADHMGIMLMAKAGYDPREAPRFWQRFGQYKENGGQPEFLSTHPNDERRAADLLELLPAATALYEQSSAKIGLGEMIRFGSQERNATVQIAPQISQQEATAYPETQVTGPARKMVAPAPVRQAEQVARPLLGSNNPLRGSAQ